VLDLSSSRRQIKTPDLFDDPHWETAPVQRRRISARPPLGISIIGSAGVAIRTMLPWYGSPEGGDEVWQFSSPGLRPTSQLLNGPGRHPGTEGFGYLILALSGATLVLAVLGWIAVRRPPRPVSNLARCLAVGVAVSATALLAVVICEVQAHPPLGDGPPPSSDWGAIVGVAASVPCLAGGAWALTTCALDPLRRRQRGAVPSRA
jgi:hypothetical protein